VQRGRLDRVLLVLPPDPPSRALFILERIQNRATISDEDLDGIVQHTEGHSFTDLKSLLDAAIHISTEHQPADRPVIHRDALRLARRDVGPSSAQWLSQAGHHAFMNEKGGLYDDLLQYFQMRQRG
jgi:SpoVK/Ycf46/Vps4 family AAA+-type ATPase